MKGGARMWKDVPGYEGLYVINESRDVITVKTGYQIRKAEKIKPFIVNR